MSNDVRVTLGRELRECRRERRWTQGDMAETLGMSRKNYVALERGGWLPLPRERAHFVKHLHDLHPPAAATLVKAVGGALEDHVVVLSPPSAGPPPLDAKQAKAAFDAALYTTAEDVETSPKTMRSIAALLFARVADSGLTLGQAVGLAKAVAGKKSAQP